MDSYGYPESSVPSATLPSSSTSSTATPMHTLSTVWGRRDVGVETSSIGVVTDPDCLGPCEPGTHVVLEGIVWNETPNGILVVNVTWRGKTYVGTLMDATRHDWAPPRFNDESPTNDLDPRTPKGRGKRGRAAASTPISESCTVGERRLRKTRGRMGSNNSQAQTPQPASPGKADTQLPNKRKGRPPEQELCPDGPRGAKRGRRADTPGVDNLIECPEPNCSKKYRHVNGLRYHLTHSHKKNLLFDSDGNMVTESTENFVKPAPVTDGIKDNGRASPKVRNGRKAALEAKVAVASPRKNDVQSEGKATVTASPKKGTDGQEGNDAETNNKSKNKSNKPSSEANGTSSKKGDSKKPVVSVAPVVSSVLNIPCVSSVRTTQTTVLPAVAAVSMANVTPSPSVDLTKADVAAAKKANKGAKTVGSKPVGAAAPMVTRPIMPAPTTLASVTTYPQVTVSTPAGTASPSTAPGLKPIQPKPTILGEPNSVNPALAASLKQMKQDSKKPKKKKKDKDKERKEGQGHKKDKEHKPHTSVIKATTVTIPTLAHLPSGDNATAAVSSKASGAMVAPPELHRQTLQPPELDKQRLTPPELHKQQGVALKVPVPSTHPQAASASSGGQGRSNRPPSSLSLNSPVSRPRDAEHDSDDVHSPAYSDISDANDAVPVLENEADVKVTKTEVSAHKVTEQGHAPDKQTTGEQGQSADRAMSQQGFSMYSNNYYSQPPYLTPAIPSAGSPSQPKSSHPHPTPGAQVQHTPPPPQAKALEDSTKRAGDEAKTAAATSGDKILVPPSPANKESERRTPKEVPSPMASSPSLPPRPSAASQPGSKDTVDKAAAAGRPGGHYGSPSQYPAGFLGAGYHGGIMPGIDPAYHMQLLATNPEYKLHHDKWMRDQERRRREHLEQQKQDSAKPVDMSAKSKSSAPPPKPQQQQQPSLAASPSMSASPSMALSPSMVQASPHIIKKEPQDRAADLSLKEKQNENRQILKENLDLKAQMEGSNAGRENKPTDATSDSKAIFERQREDLQRYYMYQQQRYMEHSRLLQHQQAKGPGSQVAGSPHGLPSGGPNKNQQTGSNPSHLGAQPMKGSPVSSSPANKPQVPPSHEASRSQHLEAKPAHDQGHRSWESNSDNKQSQGAKEGPKYPDNNVNSMHRDKAAAAQEAEKDRNNKNRAQQEGRKGEAPLPSPGGGMRPSEERRAVPSSSTPSSLPAVSAAYAHYYPHYAAAAAAGQLPFDPRDPSSALFPPGMVPYGPNTAAYMHPSQIRFPHPADDVNADKDKSLKVASPGTKPSEGGKALDLLQQRASQLFSSGGSRGPSPNNHQPHKIHELKEAGKSGGPDHSRTSSPASKEAAADKPGDRGKEVITPTSSAMTPGGKDEKGRSSSPPTQRHLHTHHHTHVVGPPYPIFGSYPSVMTSPQGAGTAGLPPHSFIPKS